MPQSLLLIGNERRENDTQQYYDQYAAFFRRSLTRATIENTEVAWTLLNDMYIEVGDGSYAVFDTRTQRDIGEYSGIIIRGMGFRGQFDVLKAISLYAKRRGVPIVNDYSAFRDSSKLAQAVQFFKHDLPVAKTIYVNRAVLEGRSPLSISFPCIMKAVHGAHGNDNYVVNDIQDIRRIAAHSEERFVLQRFVPNDGDYRILLAGDEVKVIERRAVNGSHLNNTSQGGSARLIEPGELPGGMISDARAILKVLDMAIAGVDALVDRQTGRYYFLEVNSQPQLMTGAYIEEKEDLIGSYLASLL